ncbi:MAG: LPS export ABC transporter periplasmic protein LptC [Armatimonadetes bacterium]|nr:LPS export ABC transporter periplasmic protein LptC [Armatimonadota bacterium]
MWKTVFLLSGTLLLIGGGAGYVGSRWLSGLSPQAAAPPEPEPPLESYLPELSLKGINYEVSEHGKRQWGFKAEEVVNSKDGNTTLLNGLHDGVYYKDGKPYLRMKSGAAVYNHLTKHLEMKGGVQVSGPDGLHFEAPSLTWKSDKKTIVCPGPVRMQTAEGWITSRGTLTADLKRQTFTLQQVSGQFTLDSAKGVPL